MRKAVKEPKSKNLLLKSAKVRLWSVVFTGRNQVTTLSYLFTSSCVGFYSLEILWDSALTGWEGESFAVGREERRKVPGWGRIKTFTKVSFICRPKHHFSGKAPKGSAEGANNKEVDTGQAAGGTGAEKWASSMSR